jgi:hypothetical protein
MEEDAPELTEKEAITRAEAILSAVERAKWPLLDKVIRASRRTGWPLGLEYLPPPPPVANVWQSPKVFIDLIDDDLEAAN